MGGACLLWACGDEPVRPVVRDSLPPVVDVVSPTPTAYDDDGDGLVDFAVVMHDDSGPVAVDRIRLRSLEGVTGPAGTVEHPTNLLEVWEVVERTDTLLTFRETVHYLLPRGPNRLELTVPDTAGNVAVDTIEIELPAGAWHATIPSGLTMGILPAIGLAYCPDDHRLYMTVVRRLVIYDADSLRLIAVTDAGSEAFELARPLCVPDDPILYVTDTRLQRFDRTMMAWLPEVDTSFKALGIVQSRRDPDLLYLGETHAGVVGVVDRTMPARIRQLLDFTSKPDEFIQDLVVLPNDAKLYVPLTIGDGILAVDPERDSVLARIAIGGESHPDHGRTQALALSPNDRILFAAVWDGSPRGISQISTETDSTVRRFTINPDVPIDLALSPDGTRLFVTTQDADPDQPSENRLIDVPEWRTLERFPRPRPDGVTRFDRDVVFHPSGRLIFVTHDVDLDVYLNRR